MGFMDDVSAFTKGVGQKAKGNYDIVTMNNRVSSLQKEITGIYTQIGKQYYASYGETPTDDFKELINEIKKLEEQIADTKQQIENTKVTTASVSFKATSENVESAVDGSYGFCSKCGAPLAADSLFCIKCGAKLTSESDDSEIENA